MKYSLVSVKDIWAGPRLKAFIFYTNVSHAVTQLVEALRYKPEGRGFDSPMVSLEFFIDIILLAALWPWGRLRL